MATDVDGVYEDWGTADAAPARPGHARPSCARSDFAAGSMGPKVEAAVRFVEATGKRAAIGSLADIEQIVDGTAGTNVVAATDTTEEGATMTEFGVHSEVGKLRKVMVHRPDLSLQRLTPSNHDELLFDDVLWVERAQYEHDQFVARMRERGVEVFLLHDLLAEALAASDDGTAAADRAGRVGVHRRAGRSSTRSASLLAEPQARPAGQAPDRRADRRRGRPRPGRRRRGLADRRRARRPEHVRAAAAAEHAVHPRLVVLDLRRRVDQPDVLAGPPPRGLQRGGDLQGPPDVRRRRLRVLVPARGPRRPLRDRRLRARLARRRRRDADRQRRRADRHERALAGADDRADRQGAVRARAPPSG